MSNASSTNEAGKKGADQSQGASSTHGGSANKGGTSTDEKARRGSGTGTGTGTGSNFANDPERAKEAGRKGGEHSHDKQSHDHR
jgi:uncharacterized protein